MLILIAIIVAMAGAVTAFAIWRSRPAPHMDYDHIATWMLARGLTARPTGSASGIESRI